MVFKILLSRSVQTPNSDKNWQTSSLLQTFVCNVSRHFEFVIERGHRVNWFSGSLDSRVTGSLGHKMGDRGRSEGAWSPVYRQKVLVCHIHVVYSGIVMPGSVKLSATATVANIWDSIGFLSLRNITALDNSPILCRILSRTFPCLSPKIGLRKFHTSSFREDRLCVCP